MRIAVAIAGVLTGLALEHWGGVTDAAFFGFLGGVLVGGFVPTGNKSCKI